MKFSMMMEIRTLDTMKFAMMMEMTTGSSWLMGLMPLKSLSVKVIGGRL